MCCNVKRVCIRQPVGRFGFSLMELMVVIVIIGLLASAVTVRSFWRNNFFRGSEFELKIETILKLIVY